VAYSQTRARLKIYRVNEQSRRMLVRTPLGESSMVDTDEKGSGIPCTRASPVLRQRADLR
jgi:hypothetical protein